MSLGKLHKGPEPGLLSHDISPCSFIGYDHPPGGLQVTQNSSQNSRIERMVEENEDVSLWKLKLGRILADNLSADAKFLEVGPGDFAKLSRVFHPD